MGQATVDSAVDSAVDLPDPLESRGENPDNAQAQSADDLLSQLAGDEIDRLLAESGDESAPIVDPPAEAKAPPVEIKPAPAAPPSPPLVKKSPLEEEMDLDAAIDAAARERMAIRDTHLDEPVDHSPQINLGDPVRRLPFFLRPLEWLSAPLDPWPEQIRDIIGKVGLMTLVNALAVLAYVLIFRRHHH